MPQLDRIIVFSQIFWLFIVFIVFYTVLTHFFLPKFLKAVRSRKQIIELNTLELSRITENFSLKQNLLQRNLIKNLGIVRKILVNNLSITLLVKKNLNMAEIDEKLSMVIFNNAKYCDIQLLDFIVLYSKSLNLKFN